MTAVIWISAAVALGSAAAAAVILKRARDAFRAERRRATAGDTPANLFSKKSSDENAREPSRADRFAASRMAEEADRARRAGRLDEAEKKSIAALALVEDPLPHLVLAEIALARGAWSKALAEIDEFLAADPAHPRALEIGGLAAGESGDLPAARGFYERVVAVAPTPGGFATVAEISLALGDDAAAREAFARAVSLDPANPDLRARAGLPTDENS